MSFESLMGALLLLASALLLLKNFGFKGAGVVAAFAPIVVMSTLGDKLSYVFGTYSELISIADISEYISCSLKVVGIGYLGGIGADVCRELGEGGIAKCITVAARAELLVIATPHVMEVVYMLLGFIYE